MANEATLIFTDGVPIPFTCADGTGIERGTILKMTDPFTAIAASGVNDIVAGIAATEKIASDGKTKIAVYRSGIFKVTASGSIAVGDSCGTDISNLIRSNTNTNSLSGSKSIGIALETAANGETFLMELKPTIISTSL